MSARTPDLVSSKNFLQSARDLGLTTVDAAAELADNSLDAGADRIHFQIEGNDPYLRVVVADDGAGIPVEIKGEDDEKWDGIGHALSFGGRAHGEAPGVRIGKFGWGLSSSATCQSLRTEVYTKTREEASWRFCYLDLEELAEQDTVRLPPTEEVPLPDKLNPFDEEPESGTVVVLEKCDNPDFKTPSRMRTELISQLSMIYRKFIHAGRTIGVNGTALAPMDPLYMMNDCWNPGGIPLAEPYETFTIDLPVPNHEGQTAKVVVKIVNLDVEAIRRKDEWSPHWMKEHGLTEENQGFYLMRNDRQIAQAQTFDLFTRNADLNYFRGEISFPPGLDRFFGIQTNKSRFTLKDELKDKMRAELGSTINQIRSHTRDTITRLKAKAAEEAQKTSATLGERIADRASTLLKSRKKFTPEESRQLETELEDEKENAIAEIKEDPKLEGDEKEEEIQKIEAKFEMAKLPFKILFQVLGSGHFYEPQFKGKQTRVIVNKEHAFFPVYERASQSDEQRILLDLMLQSAAHAEGMFEGKEQMEQAISVFRREWSTALQVMLEKVDDVADEVVTDVL